MNLKGRKFENSRLDMEIFVYEIEGKEWFIGKDIAELLGYSDISATVSKKVNLEYKKIIYVKTIENIGNCQNGKNEKCGIKTHNANLSMINEFGLYQLVAKSILPKAIEFQRWIYEEVLPSLRKNNFYIDNENIDNSQLKDLQLKLIDITQQRDNFSNGLLYSPNKRQGLKPFIENMFPKCEDVYSQFLDNMVKSGMLDNNFQPTDIFRKTNSARRMFIHTNKTTVDTVVDLVVTNVGMDELYRRLYVEDNILKIKKYEPKIDILKLF